MTRQTIFRGLMILLLIIVLGCISLYHPKSSVAQEPASVITGRVIDRQDQPVAGAIVYVHPNPDDEPLAQATTQTDGRYTLSVAVTIPDHLWMHIERSHFQEQEIALQHSVIDTLRRGQPVILADVLLLHRVSPAFWIATLVFAGMLGMIAAGKLHNTLAALLGVALIFLISYLGNIFSEDLFIFDFERALHYVDWNVIFLIMGMMIVIAVVERTGIFQWMAFSAYRISGGRAWLLVSILMLITGVASALLDNVTTMLLMTPITVQIAIALGINPLALLMPEVLASNVAGISTLIGTPTNILIGSYANISFGDFLVNLTPGVLLALVGLIIYCELVYRRQLHAASTPGVSPTLMERLAERARITQPDELKKAGWVGLGMLVLFLFGEQVHLIPAVTAMIGATALLVWIRPDIDEMIEAVDWTTLVFFIGLFIVVGAIQEVGLISFIADAVANMVGGNLVLAMLVMIWLSAIISTVIPNIPFTAAMLPVVGFLTATVPGAQNKVLFYCLSVGSAMGGNGSLIGASANLVTAGIAERAGYPISYLYFLKVGFPALLVTVSLATIWLLIRF